MRSGDIPGRSGRNTCEVETFLGEAREVETFLGEMGDTHEK